MASKSFSQLATNFTAIVKLFKFYFVDNDPEIKRNLKLTLENLLNFGSSPPKTVIL